MRLHVNLKVADLDQSVRFYTSLFDAAPSVTKPDYAKWSLDDPRVNFSLVAQPNADHGIEHLGIEADTPDELAELRRRITGMQGEVREEGETICCYHASDKTWITDAAGVSWETFHTSGEADSLHDPAQATGDACCATDCCA